MPVYNYRCEPCDKAIRRIHEPDGDIQICRTCGAVLVRTMKPPTARVVEVLDNGAMSKRVERLADAERIYSEHAKSRDKT
jgi:putative FmdB family regulatory protein